MLRKPFMLIVVAVTLFSGAPFAEGQSETRTGQAEQAIVTCKKINTSIHNFRQSTWRYQDQLGIQRTKAERKVWTLPCRYAKWVNNLWKDRYEKVKLDMHDPIIQKLNEGLHGTPMSGLGKILRDAGRRFNVSPYFIAAAAGTESSFGAAACGTYNHNAWGLGNCGLAWSVPVFPTWREAIMYYADFLKDHWPGATSPYHYHGYARCDECWGRQTAYYMESVFGVSSYTKYPS